MSCWIDEWTLDGLTATITSQLSVKASEFVPTEVKTHLINFLWLQTWLEIHILFKTCQEVDSRLVNMKPERDPTQRDNTMKLNDDLAPSNLRNLQRAHLI